MRRNGGDRRVGRRRFLAALSFTGAGAGVIPGLWAAGEKTSRKPTRAAKPCPSVPTPMKDVQGKVAFITGGSSGIGLGIAQAFADAGMKVALGYRTEPHLKEALAVLSGAADKIHAIKIDVTDRAAMEEAASETVRTFGAVHVLVNNAGIVNAATLLNTSYEEWDSLMAVNVGGVFNGLRAFLPVIQKNRDGGHIVSTASVAGLIVGGAGYGAYGTSKFALVGMMEALRADLAGMGIGVSVVCPWLVKTNLDPQLKNVSYAMNPLEVGRRVLKGMRANDLYILTHGEIEPLLRYRDAALLSALPRNAPIPADRAELGRWVADRSIYVREIDHRECMTD